MPAVPPYPAAVPAVLDGYSRFPVSDARSEALPTAPPKPNPPLPQRTPPTPSHISADHPDVRVYLSHIAFAFKCGFQHYRTPTPTVFALAALAVFHWPTDPAHAFFWAPQQRAVTAAAVQRVLESGASLTIPFAWTSAEWALATLAEREARSQAARLKRKAPAGGAKAAESAPTLKAPRVTRSTARKAASASSSESPPAAPCTATAPVVAPVAEKKKLRRTPGDESPQRTSARQQQRRAEQAVMPPAVVASVRPGHVRARSSSETLVAASSSRGASVLSADTVVVDVVADAGKGTAAAGAVTRSRTKKAPARATAPYPTTKPERQAGAVAGRKVPTGKRKTGKSRK
ncbi:hypothetical protein B0H15DRAFT_955719 [Mycena belliarum]|uniref:Uncharacterized protein n=1 Tax=Mycena belliarum TaxID=1033014 RepID=A0AAD6XI71_9AGAR|nr:hypothetical protein B0H15DRAFT_955719 [Mycena belliae]